MRSEAVPWWEQAQADLETARVTDAAARHYATSLFAQQAAEKALKALYIEQQGALAPRTHDLIQLGTTLGAPPNVQADLVTLNPAFDMVRYPSQRSTQAPVNVVDAVIAKEHFEAAERVLGWVQAQIP